MLGSGAPQRKGRTWGKEGGEGREEAGALGTVPAAGTFSPGVTEILQTQCMWAEYPLGNSGEEKLPWLSWRVSPQAAKGEKRESDPQEAPGIGFGPAPAPLLPFIPQIPSPEDGSAIKTPSPPRCSTPGPHRRGWPCSRLPGTPLQAAEPQGQEPCRDPPVLPVPCRAVPRRGGPARRPGSGQLYAAAAGASPALPSGSHMMPRPQHTAASPGLSRGQGGR